MPTATELPVTRVVLYQNGIGYFERRGQIEGDVLTLQVRPSQINDLLKSLTVVDASEGRAVSVSLPLEKSGDRILSELPAQVRSAGGLLDVLRVFRGARVVLRGGAGTASGRVVGVESASRQTTGSEAAVETWRATLRTDEGTLRVYPVEAIEEVVLADRTLAVGLDKSLDVSLNEGDWKPIALSIQLAGKKSHDILASYIVEMPLWKPAYRIVIDEGQPLLQGWAIVDNVSGEDWNDVELSLVAGTPMSFIYDLHTPEFAQRVDLTPRRKVAALAPVIEEPGAVRDSPQPGGAKDALQREYARSRAAAGGAHSIQPPAPPAAAAPDEGEAGAAESPASSQMDSVDAQGAKLGSLFRYDLRDPVRIPDRSSTLVAIVNRRIPGGEVVLFRPELTADYQESHPYRAVLLENKTGLTLEKGPVTIYARGSFVGEGFLERLEKDAMVFLTYSIDGNVSLRREESSAEEGLRLLKIVNGMIESQVLQIQRSRYVIRNRHDETITAYVKTARREGWKLRNAPAKAVETADALFLPVEVPSGKPAELSVEWVSPTVRSVSIDTTLGSTVLAMYLGTGKVPQEVASTIEEVLKIKARIGEIEREADRLSSQHAKFTEDQARVRSNIDVLRRTKGNQELQRTLARKLAELEESLSKLSGKMVSLDEEKAMLTGRMTALITQVSLIADEGAPG